MRKIISLTLLLSCLFGCQPNHKNYKYNEIFNLIDKIDNGLLQINKQQLVGMFGEPDRQLLYSKMKFFLSGETSGDETLSSMEYIQWKLGNIYSKYEIKSDEIEIFIYGLNSQNESEVTGYWFGLISKKAGVIRVPYFVVYEDKVLFGDFFLKPMP